MSFIFEFFPDIPVAKFLSDLVSHIHYLNVKGDSQLGTSAGT